MTNVAIDLSNITTAPAVDYSPVTNAVDRVITAAAAESLAWIELYDLCESHDDVKGAWAAAKDHYVAANPTGKRGKATNPAGVFKSRKCDVATVRRAHPRMTAAAIVDAYGNVQAAAAAIRAANRAANAPEAPEAPAGVTLSERLADVTAAVRLALADGATLDDIAAAVAAARD